MSARQRAMVIQEAKSWIGTPYHAHGRIKGAGVDCAMLPAEVYARAGVIDPMIVDKYPVDWHLHRDEERYIGYVEQYASLTFDPNPGDLVVYKWGRCFAHGGILVAKDRIVHSVIGEGVSEAYYQSGRLAGREMRFYTLWGND